MGPGVRRDDAWWISWLCQVLNEFAGVAKPLAVVRLFAMDFDWAVCPFLILHAVKMLPASEDVPPIPADDRRTRIFGWIVTVIPRVGIVRPF
jgi:hypothetical protein